MKLNDWKARRESGLCADSRKLTLTLHRHVTRLLLSASLGAFIVSANAQEEPEITYEGNYPAESTAGYLSEAPASSPGGYIITEVAVTGDRKAAYGLAKWDDWEAWLLSGPVSGEQIAQFKGNLIAALQEAGYVFATVDYRQGLLSEGLLVIKVLTGQQGSVTVKGNKNYTAEQVLEFVDWKTGDDFNYNKLFTNLYKTNSRSHIEVDSSIKPRDVGEGKRVVDVEFTVKERFPLSLAWRLDNTGIRETSDWRSTLQAQITNPFKYDGKFSVNWTTDPTELDTVNSWILGYSLPINDKVDFSLYGGASQSNVNSVLPGIDIFGEGYFLGASFISDLIETDSFTIAGTAGWSFLSSETQSTIGGNSFADRNFDLSMPRVSVSYIPKEYDAFGGKTFVTNTIVANAASTAGSTEQSSFGGKDGDSDGTFFIDIFQLSRLQKLSDDPDQVGSWSLFMDFNAQFTNETVPGPLQKAIGGQRTARGYRERAARGDYGFDATMEVRTPLLSNFIDPIKKDEDFLRKNPNYWGQHRLQFVGFFDAAKVVLRNPQPGELESPDMFSVGVGFRAGLTKYGQLSFDYGFPLRSIRGTDSAGRAHVALELLY